MCVCLFIYPQVAPRPVDGSRRNQRRGGAPEPRIDIGYDVVGFPTRGPAGPPGNGVHYAKNAISHILKIKNLRILRGGRRPPCVPQELANASRMESGGCLS